MLLTVLMNVLDMFIQVASACRGNKSIKAKGCVIHVHVHMVTRLASLKNIFRQHYLLQFPPQSHQGRSLHPQPNNTCIIPQQLFMPEIPLPSITVAFFPCSHIEDNCSRRSHRSLNAEPDTSDASEASLVVTLDTRRNFSNCKRQRQKSLESNQITQKSSHLGKWLLSGVGRLTTETCDVVCSPSTLPKNTR